MRTPPPSVDHLTDEPAPRCSYGGAQGDLAFSLDAACQQQTGDIDASNAEESQYSERQRLHRAFHSAVGGEAVDFGSEGNEGRGVAFLLLRPGFGEVGHDAVDIGLRSLESDSVLDAADRAHPVHAARVAP
jgi:hypothetical protein